TPITEEYCATPFGGLNAAPAAKLPAVIKLPGSANAENGERVAFMTVPAVKGGGSYRVRASIEQRSPDRILVIAAPLVDVNSTLRRFVADASHELRTPLAAVRAYAELFTRGAAQRPADLERSMKGISRESERMSVLVEDLLLLAHLDEGRPLVREPVPLDGVV